MVKSLFCFFLLIMTSLVLGSDAVEIHLELSKPQFFEGEPLTATFIAESNQEKMIEVEVVKFPEFRGFWSENTVLRQGPVHLSFLARKNGKAGAVIGSYNLSSMMGYSSPSIEPIKVLVRDQTQSTQVSSEKLTPVPLPLPAIPASLKQFSFSGAVGVFITQLERTEIPYRPGQPFMLRAQLVGEGNFAEINQIPLNLPANIQLVSQSTFNDSQSGRLRKIYEWVLTTEDPQLGALDLGGFLFFDPTLKKYQPLSFPKISFRLIPEIKLPENKLNTDSIIIPPELPESPYVSLLHSSLFWLIHGLVLLCAVLDIVFFQIKRRRIRLSTDLTYQRRHKMKKATQALKLKDWSTFLPLAAELARSLMDEEKRLGKNQPEWERMKLFIEADNHFRFSSHKVLTVPGEVLVSTWNDLTKRLASHPTLKG